MSFLEPHHTVLTDQGKEGDETQPEQPPLHQQHRQDQGDIHLELLMDFNFLNRQKRKLQGLQEILLI